MLRFQIALAIILVGCVALLSCGREQAMLPDTVVDDMMGSDDTSMDTMTEMMTEMMEEAAHKSWDHVMLDAPTMTVEEAAAAMNPGGTGAAHGMGPRIVYFNEVGAMANRAGIVSPAEYPVGTMIVKEVMDATDTSVITGVVTMTKTDDPMYDAHDGWIYGTPKPLSVADSGGCYSCHAKASVTLTTDSVFVTLAMMDDGMADDGMADDGTADDGMADDGMADDGMADDGMADDGMADDGMADDGMADDGMADDGMADDGMADDGMADDGMADDGMADDGMDDDGMDDDGMGDDGMGDDGNGEVQ